ncbi:hypothetical protein, partial [Alistipes senegalensis]|uniref:hypothetical protein n=1 Tax=Alistipes senegalensis TaxID=1288121 RepID=UPI001E2E666D
LSLASPQILRPGKNAGELAFFSQLIRIFGCALDTPARQCSNKFDIALAYSYLCKLKYRHPNQTAQYVQP